MSSSTQEAAPAPVATPDVPDTVELFVDSAGHHVYPIPPTEQTSAWYRKFLDDTSPTASLPAGKLQKV